MPDTSLLSEEAMPSATAESAQVPALADHLVALEARLGELEASLAQHAAPDAHNALFAAAHERLVAVEAQVAQLLPLAHGAFTLHLGAPEIAAIGDALHGRFEQTVHDVLKAHYGFTPPAKR